MRMVPCVLAARSACVYVYRTISAAPFAELIEQARRERNDLVAASQFLVLHAFARDSPRARLEVDLRPLGGNDLAD